jgi:hypothetical protein
MNASAASSGAGRWFAFGGLALAWALYVPYFFLPVAGPELSMTGAETLPACFTIPLLWPFAVGHLLFWGGSVLLAIRRWRGAAIAGLLALAVSVVMAVLFWPAYVGMYFKLLAMLVLALSAIAGGVADAKGRAEKALL